MLDKKLQMLADHAEFHMNINSVVGGGFRDPNDALVIGKRAWSWDSHPPSASFTTATDS